MKKHHLKKINLDIIGPLNVDRIFIEYDCTPMSFSSSISDGTIVYCHFIEFLDNGIRYLVSKTNNKLLEQMFQCKLPVRDVIEHGLRWIVDLDGDCELIPYRAFNVRLSDLDESYLPQHGVMIFPQNVANAPNT